MRTRVVWLRQVSAGVALALAMAAPLYAMMPEEAVPIADTAEVIQLETDPTERMTVAVNIGGKGPYPFIIDTGAQRTLISRELADTLGLDRGRIAELHSMSGTQSVRTVIIPSLEVNARSVKDIEAPALSRSHLGAAGILGIDSLQSQRVLLDFKAETMTVSPSTAHVERWDGDTIVVRAKSRFGQLVLADASVDDRKVYVIIDTGAQVSVGNSALRRKLFGRNSRKKMVPVQLISVTGGVTPAEYTTVDTIKIGGVAIKDMPIAFADVHPFRTLDLMKRPALLLGMDALRLFDRVSVDFANRKVRFLTPEGASRAPDTQTASLDDHLIPPVF